MLEKFQQIINTITKKLEEQINKNKNENSNPPLEDKDEYYNYDSCSPVSEIVHPIF